MRGVDETALAFDRAARAVGVPYAFMGAFAVMAWGEPRATTDVDTLLLVSDTNVAALIPALRKEGLTADQRDFHDALATGGHVSIFADDSIFWIDVKLARLPVERQQIAEAADVPIRGQTLRIVRPEETIAFKLSFGSPKDEQDAISILTRQAGMLDEARLETFAARLGVGPKLAALRDRVRQRVP